jgi:CPA2 family monovalent cation:H+ antiporter-2
MLIASLWGMSLNASIFLGFLICLSSTAIGLSMLQKNGGMASPMGRLALLIFIFQDLMVVPLMLLIPVLGGHNLSADQSTAMMLGKGLGVIALLIIIAKWIMPWAMNQIAASRSQELFIIGLVAICIAICSLTVWAGLSLALGAFIAGLMIAESPYNHQAISYIFPLRDLFTSVFFISIGMLLDLSYVAYHPFLVLIFTALVVIGKTAIAGGAAFALGLPMGQALLLGLTLCQVGEFSFVLAKSGMSHNLFNMDFYQLFLASSVLTMILTPVLFALGKKYGAAFTKECSFMVRLQQRLNKLPTDQPPAALHDHIIIVGFGPTGRLVAKAAQMVSIPYIIVEMNPATVRLESLKGENIVYGDAASSVVLEHIRSGEAKVMVITATAPFLIRRIIVAARAANPNLYIITRARFMQDVEVLRQLGANEVAIEEFETALDVFSRILSKLAVPRNDITQLIYKLKHENYDLLRSEKIRQKKYLTLDQYLPKVEFVSLRVEEESAAAGKNLIELNLRKRYHITVLAMERDGRIIRDIPPSQPFLPHDLLVIVGEPYDADMVKHEIFMAPEAEKTY